MKQFLCAWITWSGNQKTSKVIDRAILSVVIAYTVVLSMTASIVLGLLLLKGNSLHITLCFEATLCITVTYFFEIKVTSNILY